MTPTKLLSPKAVDELKALHASGSGKCSPSDWDERRGCCHCEAQQAMIDRMEDILPALLRAADLGPRLADALRGVEAEARTFFIVDARLDAKYERAWNEAVMRVAEGMAEYARALLAEVDAADA